MAEILENGRNACMKKLEEIFESGRRASILKIYIENFKYFNDTFGYENGEGMLESVGKFLETISGTTVYRFIGVEFVIIKEDFGQAKAIDLGSAIQDRFEHMWKIGEAECLCQAQIGIYIHPDLEADVEEINQFLDRAITKAISQGPGQVVVYDRELNEGYVREKMIALGLKNAVEEGRVNVRYRPTFDVVKGFFTRAEFYMRIFIEGLGDVGYEEFLPIAEDSGQVKEIEYFALKEVCKLIERLIDLNVEFESIALPVSSLLFLQEDFVDNVSAIKDEYNIPNGKLAIEVGEGMLTTAYFYVNVAMQELNAIGVELILNDFGTGYSGVSSILDLPISVLKLERMFVWQLETNERAGKLIEGLVHIAHSLDLKIIAEGVETDHQVKLLDSYNCEYRQGFYYAPTVDKERLIDVLGVPSKDAAYTIDEEKRNATKRLLI